MCLYNFFKNKKSVSSPKSHQLLSFIFVPQFVLNFFFLHNVYCRYSYRSDGRVEVSDAAVDGTSGGKNASRNGNPVISITVGLEVKEKRKHILGYHDAVGCLFASVARAGKEDDGGRKR